MLLRRPLHKGVSPLVALAAAVVATACSAGLDVVDHSFAFDALSDSPGVEILDYRYGDSRFPGASNPERYRKQGKSLQRTGITGPMKRPDSLYVKWRLHDENKVYEDTVDLRTRLPKEFTDCTVYFFVRGSQLYVYLVSPQQGAGMPANGPPIYRNRKVTTVYPDERKR